MKKIIGIIILTVLVSACVTEDRFEEVNRNKTSITPESLAQNYNFGTRFSTLLRNIGVTNASSAAQYFEDWGCDNFLSHTGTPFDEENGRDYMSNYMVDSWNNYPWNYFYDNVVSTAHANKKLSLKADLPVFASWSELFKVIALSKMTLWFGPVIYSEYGENKSQFEYDSEPELYEQFFENLDEIQNVFEQNIESKELKRFDGIYGGDLTKWLRYINSLRLQLAVRIVKTDPVWARREYDKAMSYSGKLGFVLTNADNFKSPTQGNWYPFYQMSESWDDCRMGAGIEEVLVGYKDPRIHVWFDEVAPEMREELGVAGRDPGWAYKGIARGGWIRNGKSERTSFSKVSAYFDHRGSSIGGTFRRVMTAAEIHFIFAEASLRGWPTPGGKTAQEWYENGIRASWSDWGAEGDVEAYITNDTNMPIDYVDPRDKDNSYKTKMTDPGIYTVKWNDGLTNEGKLEKIMTQKWIASFQHTHEMWSDYRRTGYPKIANAAKNMSTDVWGRIEDDDYIKRYVFVEQERDNNPAGVAEATRKLGGPNLISTRLWIHPAGPNF